MIVDVRDWKEEFIEKAPRIIKKISFWIV